MPHTSIVELVPFTTVVSFNSEAAVVPFTLAPCESPPPPLDPVVAHPPTAKMLTATIIPNAILFVRITCSFDFPLTLNTHYATVLLSVSSTHVHPHST
jgi:hypothetical protein